MKPMIPYHEFLGHLRDIGLIRRDWLDEILNDTYWECVKFKEFC